MSLEYPWLELSPKEDMVHEFTVDFTEDEIIANGKRFPLGHFTTEILNLPDERITALCMASDKFRVAFQRIYPLASVMFEFVPVKDADGNAIIADRTVFAHYGDFLRAEFFRAIRYGNAPRRCQHCGRFFLLTAGYNICYCNNIAPDQTKRTCRQIGAHRKRSGHVGRTPIQAAYEKAYTRLKTRKSRGKFSVNEWNAAVAVAQA